MGSVVITGASQGIGLALAKYYVNRGMHVMAISCSDSDELQSLSCDKVTDMDVSDSEAASRLSALLQGHTVDILINNAAVFSEENLGHINFDNIERQVSVNAVAPLRISETVLPFMVRGSKIGMISSRMGSITDNTSGGKYGYRMSKAALNMVGVCLANDLIGQGIAVAMIHPGFVNTQLVNFDGDISPDESARRIAERLEELNLKNTGTFWHAIGEELPW